MLTTSLTTHKLTSDIHILFDTSPHLVDQEKPLKTLTPPIEIDGQDSQLFPHPRRRIWTLRPKLAGCTNSCRSVFAADAFESQLFEKEDCRRREQI